MACINNQREVPQKLSNRFCMRHAGLTLYIAIKFDPDNLKSNLVIKHKRIPIQTAKIYCFKGL